MVDKTKKTRKTTSKKAKVEPEKVDVFASPVTGMVYETTILLKNEPMAKDQDLTKVAYHEATGQI